MTSPQSPSDIPAARAAILSRLADAAKQSGRAPDAVTLVAVSKKQPDERIEAMLASGQRVFGENRVQEAQARWRDRRAPIRIWNCAWSGPSRPIRLRMPSPCST
jgi:uncharacterized pyridoxal phosphate-containing UPF0001 family protein